MQHSKELKTAAQTPPGVLDYHAGQLHEVINDFFTYNEAGDITEHITSTFNDSLLKTIITDDDSMVMSESYIKDMVHYNAQIVTFFAKLNCAWSNYYHCATKQKEVSNV